MTIPQRLKPIASPDHTTRMASDSYDKSSMFLAEAILRAAFKPINYGKITLCTSKSIEIYGSGEPTCTINVHNPRCFKRALFGGSVGIGESYMDGDWEVDHLVNLIRIFANERNDYDNLLSRASKIRVLVVPWTRWLQRNSTSGSRSNIHAHYDLGNEFSQMFLDSRMMYSCANFDDPHASLEQASELKLERVCQKLQLHKDDHLLKIGTGWGVDLRSMQRQKRDAELPRQPSPKNNTNTSQT